MTDLEVGQLLTDEEYYAKLEEFGDEFVAKMGAEAIQALLKAQDINEEIARLREEIPATNSETKIKKLSKRLKLMEAFVNRATTRWMIATVRPCCRRICVRSCRSTVAALQRRISTISIGA
jgi:DNA-directed RNA polymerase subunit beta'